MAKFMMQCPACNHPIMASTGWFAKKKIKCVCGHMVDVEVMAQEECPECGELVVYDRTETYTPSCPGCNHVINVRKRILQAMKDEEEKVFKTVNLSEITSKKNGQ